MNFRCAISSRHFQRFGYIVVSPVVMIIMIITFWTLALAYPTPPEHPPPHHAHHLHQQLTLLESNQTKQISHNLKIYFYLISCMAPYLWPNVFLSLLRPFHLGFIRHWHWWFCFRFFAISNMIVSLLMLSLFFFVHVVFRVATIKCFLSFSFRWSACFSACFSQRCVRPMLFGDDA